MVSVEMGNREKMRLRRVLGSKAFNDLLCCCSGGVIIKYERLAIDKIKVKSQLLRVFKVTSF